MSDISVILCVHLSLTILTPMVSAITCNNLTATPCPVSSLSSGICLPSGECACELGYYPDTYGCQEDIARPSILSDYPDAGNEGETGASLGLTCNPSHLADGAYAWTVNDVLVADANTSYHVIILPNGAVSVRCSYTHRGRSATSGTFTMTGREYPDSYSKFRPLIVQAVDHTLVEFTCTGFPLFKDHSSFRFRWTSFSGFNRNTDTNHVTYEINAGNAGTYFFCGLSDYDHSINSLQVPRSRGIRSDIPDLRIQESTRFASSGASVSLTCGFTDDSVLKTSTDITWYWYLNDVEQPDAKVSDLLLSNVTNNTHGGFWNCKAQYQTQPLKVSQPVVMYVDLPLVVTLTAVPSVAVRNGSMEIQCRESFPFDVPMTYWWTRNESVLEGYEHHTLYVNDLDDDVIGQYRCYVTVDLQTSASNVINVNVPISFSEIPAPVAVKDGTPRGTPLSFTERHNVTCLIHADWLVPGIEIEFLRDGVTVLRSAETKYTIINDVITREYSCRAIFRSQSSAMSNGLKAEFQVIKSVEIHEERRVISTDSANLSAVALNCDVTLHDGVPNNVTYTWYDADGLISQATRILTIIVTQALNATYVCEAQVGSHSRVAEIGVDIVLPEESSNLDTLVIVIVSVVGGLTLVGLVSMATYFSLRYRAQRNRISATDMPEKSS